MSFPFSAPSKRGKPADKSVDVSITTDSGHSTGVGPSVSQMTLNESRDVAQPLPPKFEQRSEPIIAVKVDFASCSQ